ncbi:hypothetical protein AB0N50_38605, partial [Streptomyces pharetrae]|uniref:hypothetical protein n=1 Tax=Streptomyces pharetrae TaxID=291370 RepID=UPI003460BC9D
MQRKSREASTSATVRERVEAETFRAAPWTVCGGQQVVQASVSDGGGVERLSRNQCGGWCVDLDMGGVISTDDPKWIEPF